MIRIVLADDHSLVRTGLSQLLDAQADIEVVGLASDGREALQLARGLTPDVVLMDLQMPIVDGITAIGILAASNPEIAVIALTTFQEPQQVTAALAAGRPRVPRQRRRAGSAWSPASAPPSTVEPR